MERKAIKVIASLHIRHEDKSAAMRWLNKQHTGKEQIPEKEETPQSLKAALQEFHSSHILTLQAVLNADGTLSLGEA